MSMCVQFHCLVACSLHSVLQERCARRWRCWVEDRHGKVREDTTSTHTRELNVNLPIGPYFVSFPNLREALNNRVPIQTQARACTILPNFVGCVLSCRRFVG